MESKCFNAVQLYVFLKNLDRIKAFAEIFLNAIDAHISEAIISSILIFNNVLSTKIN